MACWLLVVKLSWRHWYILLLLLHLTSPSVLASSPIITSLLESSILGALIKSLVMLINAWSMLDYLRLLELLVLAAAEVTILQIIEFWNTSQSLLVVLVSLVPLVSLFVVLRFITTFVNRFLLLL